jgi:hypothetical protein
MHTKSVLILIMIGLFTLVGLTVYAQEDIEFVEDSGFTSTMRPLPAFMHDEHNEKAGIEDCSECHHVYDEAGNRLEDESSEDQECSECHGAQGDEYPMELVSRYHMNCKGCHQANNAGPVTCGTCHVIAAQ